MQNSKASSSSLIHSPATSMLNFLGLSLLLGTAASAVLGLIVLLLSGLGS